MPSAGIAVVLRPWRSRVPEAVVAVPVKPIDRIEPRPSASKATAWEVPVSADLTSSPPSMAAPWGPPVSLMSKKSALTARTTSSWPSVCSRTVEASETEPGERYSGRTSAVRSTVTASARSQPWSSQRSKDSSSTPGARVRVSPSTWMASVAASCAAAEGAMRAVVSSVAVARIQGAVRMVRALSPWVFGRRPRTPAVIRRFHTRCLKIPYVKRRKRENKLLTPGELDLDARGTPRA